MYLNRLNFLTIALIYVFALTLLLLTNLSIEKYWLGLQDGYFYQSYIHSLSISFSDPFANSLPAYPWLFFFFLASVKTAFEGVSTGQIYFASFAIAYPSALLALLFSLKKNRLGSFFSLSIFVALLFGLDLIHFWHKPHEIFGLALTFAALNRYVMGLRNVKEAGVWGLLCGFGLGSYLPWMPIFITVIFLSTYELRSYFLNKIIFLAIASITTLPVIVALGLEILRFEKSPNTLFLTNVDFNFRSQFLHFESPPAIFLILSCIWALYRYFFITAKASEQPPCQHVIDATAIIKSSILIGFACLICYFIYFTMFWLGGIAITAPYKPLHAMIVPTAIISGHLIWLLLRKRITFQLCGVFTLPTFSVLLFTLAVGSDAHIKWSKEWSPKAAEITKSFTSHPLMVGRQGIYLANTIYMYSNLYSNERLQPVLFYNQSYVPNFVDHRNISEELKNAISSGDHAAFSSWLLKHDVDFVYLTKNKYDCAGGCKTTPKSNYELEIFHNISAEEYRKQLSRSDTNPLPFPFNQTKDIIVIPDKLVESLARYSVAFESQGRNDKTAFFIKK